jgi:DNA-binding transcriptional MocR family regulator
MGELPNIREIAKHLGVADETVQRWEKHGLIEAKPSTGSFGPITIEEARASMIGAPPLPRGLLHGILERATEEQTEIPE